MLYPLSYGGGIDENRRSNTVFGGLGGPSPTGLRSAIPRESSDGAAGSGTSHAEAARIEGTKVEGTRPPPLGPAIDTPLTRRSLIPNRSPVRTDDPG